MPADHGYDLDTGLPLEDLTDRIAQQVALLRDRDPQRRLAVAALAGVRVVLRPGVRRRIGGSARGTLIMLGGGWLRRAVPGPGGRCGVALAAGVARAGDL